MARTSPGRRTGADSGDFTIDPATGVLSFAQRPNFEIPVDAGTDNVYNVTVRARDTASNTRELEVVVTVTDVNERPDIDEDTVPSYVEIEYDFTGTRDDVHTFTATDYDAGDTFAWSLLGTDAAYLDIGATTGILTFAQDTGFGHGPLPNFEFPRDDDAGDGSSNTYSITVVATDNHMKAEEYAVVVTVTNVNEVPEFTGTPETAITLDEHDANDNYVVMDLSDYDAYDEEGGVTWSLTGTDRSDFAISADGVVTFVKTPNFEAPEDSGGNNVYELQCGRHRRRERLHPPERHPGRDGDSRRRGGGRHTRGGQPESGGGTDRDLQADRPGRQHRHLQHDLGYPITGDWGDHGPGSPAYSPPPRQPSPGSLMRTSRGRRSAPWSPTPTGEGLERRPLSEETMEVTANPIANAPPRLRGGSILVHVEEGPAGRNVGTPHFRD